uniref:RAD51 interacting motif domain-containing protein n=1 Tax=Trichobilharzia regenti TaxID=157069 RepID=A0AA85KM55_TRIRE|nr:unnamed protein product [Trichobilharzia regenti]CAH8853460.1 unnamed protein product [Trichobilharzia regenti]
MTEKRSARQRKVQNYSLLADESDEEFFYDDEPVKHKKKYDDDDDDIESTKSTMTKPSEAIPASKENQLPKTVNEIKPTNFSPAVVSHSETPKSPVIISPTPRFLSKSVPTTPVQSAVSLSNSAVTPPPSSLGKAFIPVTPSSGLRLGLSRTKKLRPLHTNVRIT